LDAGALSTADVAGALGINGEDVSDLASGHTSISAGAWNRLAALIAGRLN
jgi:plasmid maintenance system antidote protein VapI